MKYKELDKEWSNHWFQFILDHPDKDWDWYDLSKPNISWDIIQAHPDKDWRWSHISDNSVYGVKARWINKRRLKHIKVFQIQRHWRNCSCNPQFKLAQRCLLRLHSS